MKKFLVLLTLCIYNVQVAYSHIPSVNLSFPLNEYLFNEDSVQKVSEYYFLLDKYKIKHNNSNKNSVDNSNNNIVLDSNQLQHNYSLTSTYNNFNLLPPFLQQVNQTNACCPLSLTFTSTFPPVTSSASTFIHFEGELELEPTEEFTFLAGTEIVFNLNFTSEPTTGSVTAEIELCTPDVVMDAGVDFENCGKVVDLENASADIDILWSTLGDGTFGTEGEETSQNINDVYNAGPEDMEAGLVRLVLTPDASGSCIISPDTVTITLSSGPQADILMNDTVACLGPLTLVATERNGTGLWSDNGAGGDFSDGGSTETIYTPPATYLPGEKIIINYNVSFPECPSGKDSVTISYVEPPTVNIIAGKTACDASFIELSAGDIEGVFKWEADQGTFTADQSSSNPTRFVVPEDLPDGTSVTFNLTFTDENSCIARDEASVIFYKQPEVNLGSDLEVCNNVATINWTSEGNYPEAIYKWTTSVDDDDDDDDEFENPDSSPSVITVPANFTDPVTITLTKAIGRATCGGDVDSLQIVFGAGQTEVSIITEPQSTCADSILLEAKGDAGIFNWIASVPGGIFSDVNSLQTYYTKPADYEGDIEFSFYSNVGECTSDTQKVIISFTESQIFARIFGTSGNGPICDNLKELDLNGGADPDATGYLWTTTGNGYFNDSTLEVSIYHITPEDVERGSILATFAVTFPTCTLSTSLNIEIVDGPKAELGPDRTTCDSTIVLTVEKGGAFGSSWWEGYDGNLVVSSTDVSNEEITYTASPEELTLGKVKLLYRLDGNFKELPKEICNSATDSITINFIERPFVSAGKDMTICFTEEEVQLEGSVTPLDAKVKWSTNDGEGEFKANNDSIVDAVYILSASDIIRGSVSLTLAGIGECSADSTITIDISNGQGIDAGVDTLSVCKDSVVLVGKGSGSVYWTDGGLGGEFLPDSTDLEVTYVAPSVHGAIIQLELLSESDQAGCGNRDSIVLDFQSSPTAEIAGGVPTITTSGTSIILEYEVTGGPVEWVVPTGVVHTAGSDPNTEEFTVDAVPEEPVSVVLIVGEENCIQEKDTILITFGATDPLIVIQDNESEITSCKGFVDLSFEATGAVSWTSEPEGTFVEEGEIVTFTPGDVGSGPFLIIASLDGSLLRDSITINFIERPVASAGKDMTVCFTEDEVQLEGSVTPLGAKVKWSTTDGEGSFKASNDSIVDAVYILSASDIARGTVSMTLSALGECTADSTITIEISNGQGLDAGVDTLSVCRDSIVLTGKGTGEFYWTDGGLGGEFLPDSTELEVTYVAPSAHESLIKLELLSVSGSSGCGNRDSIFLDFQSAPVAIIAGGVPTISTSGTSIILDYEVIGGPVEWVVPAGVVHTSGTEPNTEEFTVDTFPEEPVSVVLIVGEKNCIQEKDTILITFGSISNDIEIEKSDSIQTTCNTSIEINFEVTGSDTVLWTSDAGQLFIVNEANNKLTFTPDPGTSGNVTIIGKLSKSPDIADTIFVKFSEPPFIEINGGNDAASVCADSILLPYVYLGNSVVWSASEAGEFIDDFDKKQVVFYPDSSNGNVLIKGTIKSTAFCKEVSDSVLVSFSEILQVDAGEDQVVCDRENSIVKLNGKIKAGTGSWSTLGTGDFVPSKDSLITSYVPSAADLQAGALNFVLNGNGCTVLSDMLEVTFIKSPTANAGDDFEVCSNNSLIQLSGVVNSLSSVWRSNGTGTFVDNDSTSQRTGYLPSEEDIIRGNVFFYLIPKTSNNCIGSGDELIVKINKAPEVIAGDDKIVCSSEGFVELNGTVVSSNGIGSWAIARGTGKLDNPNVLNARYTPTPSDISLGSVLLTLNAAGGHPSCKASRDDIEIKFSDSPVNAGEDMEFCASGADTVYLKGLVVSGVKAEWEPIGSGSWFNLNPQGAYLPSAEDVSKDSLVFRLVAESSPAGCNGSLEDIMIVHFIKGGGVSAGNDQEICGGNNIKLNGSVIGGEGARWNSLGDGKFIDSLNLITEYLPSSKEIQAGKTSIILEVENSSCEGAKSDTLNITFTPGPEISAGLDQSICGGSDSITLSGKVVGAVGSTEWGTDGTGTFGPNIGSLDVVYTISTDDKSRENLKIWLKGIAGNCIVDDTLRISFLKGDVSAGTDQQVCLNNAEVQLAGEYNGTGKVRWTAINGDGTFIPNDSTLNAVYRAGAKDTTNGKIVLKLQSESENECGDEVVITFLNTPGVSVGPDQIICPTMDSVEISGIIGNHIIGLWETEGDGKFTDAESLKTYYIPGINDIKSDTIFLSLSSYSDDNCNAAKAQLKLIPQKTGAGEDKRICNTADTIHLVRLPNSILGPGTWNTDGTGSITEGETFSVYNFTPEDKQKGVLNFVLTTDSNSKCGATLDTMKITFTPSAQVSAGLDISICANENISLSGTITGGAKKGKWISEGDGRFYPSDTVLNASYKLGVGDINKTSLQLYLMSTDGCNTSADTIEVSITPNSVVDAGEDIFVCAESVSNVELKGKLLSGTGNTIWRTTGKGLFTPSITSKNVTYLFNNEETNSAGEIEMMISTDGIPSCPPVVDTVIVKILEKPTVHIGGDVVGGNVQICRTSSAVLIGNIDGGRGTGKWWSEGTGSFSSDTLLNTIYKPSAEDITDGYFKLALSSTGNIECGFASDTVNLIILANDGPELPDYEDKEICSGGSVNLIDEANSELVYQWTPTIGLSDSMAFSPTVSLNNESGRDTTYSYIVSVSEKNVQCFSRDTINIKVYRQLNSNAGKDSVVCIGQPHKLGEPEISGVNYKWSGEGIIDSLIPNPVFFAKPEYIGDRFIFTLETFIENTSCSGKDTVSIIVRQGPEINAGNDTSLCVGNSLSLGQNNLTGNVYKWYPAEGLSSDSISNPIYTAKENGTIDYQKKYILSVLNTVAGCVVADTIYINVRPKPRTNVILNDTTTFCGIPYTGFYAVSGSNESIYTWDVIGGEISSGEGTGSIAVDWSNSLSKALKVTQTGLNGCTDTVPVVLKNGSISVMINSVTKLEDDTKNYIYWDVFHADSSAISEELKKLVLKRKGLNNNDTITLGKITSDSLFIDTVGIDPSEVYEYSFSYASRCGGELRSIPHNNISLDYDIFQENDYAIMNWNPYSNWPKGVEGYELWRKVDNAEYYMFESMDSSRINTTYYNDPEALSQCFRIKAIDKENKKNISWSNEKCVNTKLRIPNAISPNGDNINDYWIIENINLYPDNEVSIYNQWHTKVYEKKSYNNDWDGKDMMDGTYYYVLKTGKIVIKGYILIMR